jgi:hypothetical protein
MANEVSDWDAFRDGLSRLCQLGRRRLWLG